MPKGFIVLTRTHDAQTVRVAVSAIAWYLRREGGQHAMPHTLVTLHTRSEGENETLRVLETEVEIDALLDAAQGVEVVA